MTSKICLRGRNCTLRFFEGLVVRSPNLNHCKLSGTKTLQLIIKTRAFAIWLRLRPEDAATN